jgi:hypothetical protein
LRVRSIHHSATSRFTTQLSYTLAVETRSVRASTSALAGDRVRTRERPHHCRALLSDDPEPHHLSALSTEDGRSSRPKPLAVRGMVAAAPTCESNCGPPPGGGEIGATAWVRRSEDEPRAAGASFQHAQESQVARPSAVGFGNLEIGLRLHLSPRTASSHLCRVFPKLGVTSRDRLRDLDLDAE